MTQGAERPRESSSAGQRLKALEWARREMLRLAGEAGRDPGNPQVRADASLILEAADELVTGREPRSVTSQVGRITRYPSEAEWQALLDLRNLRARIPRAPGQGARQDWEIPWGSLAMAAVGLHPSRDPVRRRRQAEQAWRDIRVFADLDEEEAEAVRLRRGLGWTWEQAAEAMDVPVGRVSWLVARALEKLAAYVASREWTGMTEFVNQR